MKEADRDNESEKEKQTSGIEWKYASALVQSLNEILHTAERVARTVLSQQSDAVQMELLQGAFTELQLYREMMVYLEHMRSFAETRNDRGRVFEDAVMFVCGIRGAMAKAGKTYKLRLDAEEDDKNDRHGENNG